MDEDRLKFVVAYATLCKKHGLCVAPQFTEDICLAEYDEGWVESLALGEGVETFKAYQSEMTEQMKAGVEVLAKLQTLRGYLFRLKGYLEAEAAGYPRVDLDWTIKSLEIVKALQLEVWECQSTR